MAVHNFLLHADWSKEPRKRWIAAARRIGHRWSVDGPAPAPAPHDLVDMAFCGGADAIGVDGFRFSDRPARRPRFSWITATAGKGPDRLGCTG
jgi:hypothetical protein